MHFSNDFSKPNGFSLIELLIAAGLSFLVIISSAYLIEGMLGQDRAMKGAITADTQLDQADFIIQRYFRTAVDVKWVNSIANNQALNSFGGGMLVQGFNSDRTTPAPPADYSITTLALFYRDTAVVPSTSFSALKPTGMYYQQNGPLSYGVLYIDDGSNGPTLGPSLSNVVVDHITQLQTGTVTTTVMQVGAATPLYVRSIPITITVRVPLYTNGNALMTWCAPNQTAAEPACANSTIPFKDTSRTITVILYDNADPTAVPADGPALGRIYFAR